MSLGQKIRGFVGQGMSGRRAFLSPACATFILGTTSHTVTKTGWHRIVAWGGGASGLSSTRGGGSGQLYIAERMLIKGQVLSVVVGGADTDSTVTLPSGEVITAKTGSGATGGSSSTKLHPSDIIVNGNNATTGSAAPGAAGPSYLDYRGGTAGSGGSGSTSKAPAAGGSASETVPGIGMVLIHQVRMRL